MQRCLVGIVIVTAALTSYQARPDSGPPAVAVSPQYDTTHVYVALEDFDRFTASVVATLGGSKSKQGVVLQVTPTPSQTLAQLVFTPVGTLSVFAFKTPTPYGFGTERTGYLVTDFDAAVSSARALGADVVVEPFTDVLGRDAIIEWPGGIRMQLYWHNTAPDYAALEHVPENRCYISAARADTFIAAFTAFSHGKVTSDVPKAPGVEIGHPQGSYRSVLIESPFQNVRVLVTDGHLPYPFGREVTGYAVESVKDTVEKAKAAGVSILVPPFSSRRRQSAFLRFPGGYIAEVHSDNSK